MENELRLIGFLTMCKRCELRFESEAGVDCHHGMSRQGVATEETCPIWKTLDAISDKAYFVSWDEYMQHQHEMIDERMQRMAEQMLEDLKTAPHYPTEGTFWKNKEK